MRKHGFRLLVMLLLVSSGSLATPGYAQDADTLRRELEALRRQLSTMTQVYEVRLKALSDRVEQLEGNRPPATPPLSTSAPPKPLTPSAAPATTRNAAPAAVPGAPPAAPASAPPVAVAALAPSAVAQAPAAQASEGPTLKELLTPRQPFALSTPGRTLLFDIGVSGDFVADLTSARAERHMGPSRCSLACSSWQRSSA
jgi:hypothetical protein